MMVRFLAKVLLGAVLTTAMVQCGVKGDPLPPLQPHVTDQELERFGDSGENGAKSRRSKKDDTRDE